MQGLAVPHLCTQAVTCMSSAFPGAAAASKSPGWPCWLPAEIHCRPTSNNNFALSCSPMLPMLSLRLPQASTTELSLTEQI